MNSLMFAYAEARQLEIKLDLARRRHPEYSLSMRDRLGRTLIAWGEHLMVTPRQAAEQPSVRPAA
ncbi:MAG: hypothetical protein ACRDWH_00600 [Acidimicrobiia bacterium]